MKISKKLTFALLLLLGFSVSLAVAQTPARTVGSSSWIVAPQLSLRLIAAAHGLALDGTATLGLQVRLEPGWHFYWRTPGEAGIPPEFDWSGSRNLAQTDIRWPAPKRVTMFDLDSFVYEDEIVLPISVRAANADAPLAVALTVRFGVCKDICVPYEERLSLMLEANRMLPTALAPLIARYDAKVPAGDGVVVEAIRAIELDGKPGLEVAARSEQPFVAPDLLVEGPADGWFGRPEIVLEDGGRRGVFRLPADRPLQAPVTLTLTFLDGGRAVEVAETLARR